MNRMNTPHPQDDLFDSKPVRVTVPVSPAVLAVFRSLASSSGMSTGKAMGQWLADTSDAAEYMAVKLQKARMTPRLVAQELHSYAQGLADSTSEIMEQLRLGAGVLEAAARKGAPRPAVPRSARAPLYPPSSNTGGKVPKVGKKPQKGRS